MALEKACGGLVSGFKRLAHKTILEQQSGLQDNMLRGHRQTLLTPLKDPHEKIFLDVCVCVDLGTG